ncbi:MAG: ribulose bisphosphate carboxylase small subunit [Alphaproteobacteria bacterium]|nr:ribulose bisphosphate carboxylase small subunit [Alphaproteobacteria bacterium]MDD9919209.1 ribulose bisphosphate carboxylase small subunit [Alphaproteobacteria bacterium]
MNSRFETFSFLPPLSTAQAQAQADSLLHQGFIPVIEFSDPKSVNDVYWQQWPIVAPRSQQSRVMPQDINASLLMMQIESCFQRHPYAYVRLSGYDPERQTNAQSFIVKTPSEV